MTPRLELPAIRRALAAHEPDVGNIVPEARRAAVAAVLRTGDAGVEVLLMRRAERSGDPWSGHMAFPGGHVEQNEDFEAAARRETMEEVGLDLDRYGRRVGHLDLVHAQPRTRARPMVVAPIVYELRGTPPPLQLNYEVAETLWAPLMPMVRGEVHTSLEYELSGRVQQFPGYDVEGRVVWGMTYRMLGTLFSVLGVGDGDVPFPEAPPEG